MNKNQFIIINYPNRINVFNCFSINVALNEKDALEKNIKNEMENINEQKQTYENVESENIHLHEELMKIQSVYNAECDILEKCNKEYTERLDSVNKDLMTSEENINEMIKEKQKSLNVLS